MLTLPAAILVVGIVVQPPGERTLGGVDYRLHGAVETTFSDEVTPGLDDGLDFMIEADGEVADDVGIADTGLSDLSGPMPTTGGDPDGAGRVTVAAPLPTSGGLCVLGLGLLASRRRR